MTNNYIGPGWYWVEGTDQPLFLTCTAGRLTTMMYVENIGVRESTTSRGKPFKILAHIPRPAQRPIVDWSVMPAWAKWVCVNEDGYWYWSAGKPELTPDGWMSEWQEGAIPEQFAPKYTGDWRNSLVERPE